MLDVLSQATIRATAVTSATLLALAACQSAGSGTSSVPSAASSSRAAGLSDTNLYVANSGGKTSSPGSVMIYGLKRGKLLGTVTDGIDRPTSIGYDAAANLIAVADAEPATGKGSGSVALFAPGDLKPTIVLKGTSDPVSLAFDTAGKIYVADFHGGINIYVPNNTRPIRKIPGDASGYYGVYAPRFVAVDPLDNVYVANGPFAVGSSDNVFALTVFPRGKSTGQNINAIGHPRAMICASGGIYVAFASRKGGPNPDGTVQFYRFGSYRYLTIKAGLDMPDALAVDASGNLYVANLNAENVTVYRPGETVPSRTITSGIHSPKALAIGPEGNLYVSSLYEGTVTVYKPGQSSPFLTIKPPVATPVALTLNAPSPAPSPSHFDR